jgi:hypothetical protein
MDVTIAIATLVCMAGCSRASGVAETQASGSPATGATSIPTVTAAKPAGPKVITIAKLGLKGSAAGETEDPTIGDGDPIMVMAAGFVVNVAPAKASDSKTIKDAQNEGKLYNATHLQSETLADGWVVTFENTGSAGTNYWMESRRTIGGKAYMCSTMQSTPDQQKAAVAFCKSLTQ